MRQFTSYGPAESRAHFYVERRVLVERCIEQLVGTPEEVGGHYFTIWGPRQTGKTWVMRRAVDEIRKRYGDRFTVGWLTMEGRVKEDAAPDDFLARIPSMLWEGLRLEVPKPADWDGWMRLFERERGVFDKPTILLIDEFDQLPPGLIEVLVRLFRRMYLDRETYMLHGLALIGVRAVLGVDSPRGSPFNVQRSLPIPNLTRDEVIEMFRQYQAESAQIVEPNVVEALFDTTRGQPGLVGWFGELLTDKYNPGKDKPITMFEWRRTYGNAIHVEWNNTLLNLSKKARGPYRADVLKLFTDPNIPFSMERDWCSYLYMNGLIDKEPLQSGTRQIGVEEFVCRFSSPFVQQRLYLNLTAEMFGDKGPLLALEIGDTLDDVFTAQGIDTVKLLAHYRGYLKRLKAKGIDPWIGQPRRQDLHYTEAVGHFHLYAWLLQAVGRRSMISPEFPTGNGKVDLMIRIGDQMAVLEVKSFVDMYELGLSRKQAAGYAQKLGLTTSTLVVFAPTDDDTVLEKLVGDDVVDGIRVLTVPFGWV